MSVSLGKIECIKIGKIAVQPLVGSKRTEMSSGIKKMPVEKAILLRQGFKDDEQADTLHHGGGNKAVLCFSSITYEKLNTIHHIHFAHDNSAYYGENLVISSISEDDICVGDELQIGQNVRIVITQPRQPCWKLSAHTGISTMTQTIFEQGHTGWYAKVVNEGEICRNDLVSLIHRPFPDLTIRLLNRLMVDPKCDIQATQKALKCDALGAAFKRSLEKRVHGSDEMVAYQS